MKNIHQKINALQYSDENLQLYDTVLCNKKQLIVV